MFTDVLSHKIISSNDFLVILLVVVILNAVSNG